MRTHTKFKKVLSVVLSTALVVTGVNLPGGKTAKADGTIGSLSNNVKQKITSYALSVKYVSTKEPAADSTSTLSFCDFIDAEHLPAGATADSLADDVILTTVNNNSTIRFADLMDAKAFWKASSDTGIIQNLGYFKDTTGENTFSLQDIVLTINGYKFKLDNKTSEGTSTQEVALGDAWKDLAEDFATSSDGFGAKLKFTKLTGFELYAPYASVASAASAKFATGAMKFVTQREDAEEDAEILSTEKTLAYGTDFGKTADASKLAVHIEALPKADSVPAGATGLGLFAGSDTTPFAAAAYTGDDLSAGKLVNFELTEAQIKDLAIANADGAANLSTSAANTIFLKWVNNTTAADATAVDGTPAENTLSLTITPKTITLDADEFSATKPYDEEAFDKDDVKLVTDKDGITDADLVGSDEVTLTLGELSKPTESVINATESFDVEIGVSLKAAEDGAATDITKLYTLSANKLALTGSIVKRVKAAVAAKKIESVKVPTGGKIALTDIVDNADNTKKLFTEWTSANSAAVAAKGTDAGQYADASGIVTGVEYDATDGLVLTFLSGKNAEGKTAAELLATAKAEGKTLSDQLILSTDGVNETSVVTVVIEYAPVDFPVSVKINDSKGTEVSKASIGDTITAVAAAEAESDYAGTPTLTWYAGDASDDDIFGGKAEAKKLETAADHKITADDKAKGLKVVATDPNGQYIAKTANVAELAKENIEGMKIKAAKIVPIKRAYKAGDKTADANIYLDTTDLGLKDTDKLIAVGTVKVTYSDADAGTKTGGVISSTKDEIEAITKAVELNSTATDAYELDLTDFQENYAKLPVEDGSIIKAAFPSDGTKTALLKEMLTIAPSTTGDGKVNDTDATQLDFDYDGNVKAAKVTLNADYAEDGTKKTCTVSYADSSNNEVLAGNVKAVGTYKILAALPALKNYQTPAKAQEVGKLVIAKKPFPTAPADQQKLFDIAEAKEAIEWNNDNASITAPTIKTDEASDQTGTFTIQHYYKLDDNGDRITTGANNGKLTDIKDIGKYEVIVKLSSGSEVFKNYADPAANAEISAGTVEIKKAEKTLKLDTTVDASSTSISVDLSSVLKQDYQQSGAYDISGATPTATKGGDLISGTVALTATNSAQTLAFTLTSAPSAVSELSFSVVKTDADGNYEVTLTVNLTLLPSGVAKKDPQLTVTKPAYTGEEYAGLTIKDSTGNALTDANKAQYTATYYDSEGTELTSVPKDAGKYSVKVVYQNNADLAQATEYGVASEEFEITKVAITVNPNAATQTYIDGKNTWTALDFTAGTVSGLINGQTLKSKDASPDDVIIFKTDATATSASGTYDIVAKDGVEVYDANNDIVTANYDITFGKGTITVIAKKKFTVTAANADYTGAAYAGAIAYTAESTFAEAPGTTGAGSKTTVTYTKADGTPIDAVDADTNGVPISAGDYTIKAVYSNTDGYAEATYDFTINKIKLTVTAKDKTYVVGTDMSEPAYDYDVTGTFVSGQAFDASASPVFTCPTFEEANGDFPITISNESSVKILAGAAGNDLSKNYDITYVAGKITVSGASIDKHDEEPTDDPSVEPATGPAIVPSTAPSRNPSSGGYSGGGGYSAVSPSPSASASASPSASASASPSASADPSANPSANPSTAPGASSQPGTNPSAAPSAAPSTAPSVAPSTAPTVAPTATPAAKNKCKKVTPKKKTYTIKKKGKTVKVIFKLKNANSKKKTTDKVTTKIKNSKIAKVTKVTLKKKQLVVTVKAKKKGKTKLTVKVGKKSAKVTIKVKK